MRALLIDDSVANRKTLRKLIEEYTPTLEIVGEASTITEAIELIETCEPDLVFLDVELSDGQSFDVLNAIDHIEFETIFITAYDQYAAQAFRVNAVDYLLKPINIKELIDAVDRTQKRFEQRSSSSPAQTKFSKSVGITSSNGVVFVDPSDITYCEADGAYTRCYTSDQTILSSKNLKEFEQFLEAHGFLRVHHSFLVNLAHIKSFQKEDSSLLLSDDREVPVSQRRKKQLMDMMSIV